MNDVRIWLTGITALAITATIFSSKYSAGILTAGGGAIAKVYQGAKK